MVRIEIELLGENVQNDIYDLRNYLKEHLPDADFAIKDQPPAEGQMGVVEHILNGTLHASVAIIFEELYHNLLRPLYKEWMNSRKNAGVKLELMSSLTNNDDKIRFVEDSNGNTQVYNYKYAIDTDKTFALLIGVGQFTSDFHPIPPVKRNLEDFSKLLTNKKHIGIARENVSISYNESHVEIQKRLMQAARRQDLQTLIIYFAGHGHRTDVKKLSLIATDTEKVGDEIIGGIDFDFISNKVLKSSPARQKILILDTCHSGIATQGSDDLTANFDVKGSYILTSSPGDDVSYFEKNAKHTYFTGALLDVLENGIDNTNDMLALEDLYDYTKEVLSEKKFPHPHVKSELNILPSNFFVAHNPSFSAEKLKWRAYNLFRDGKLEEAMDQFRDLLKRFPYDEALRRQFEECETELSFSKLVNEANTLFYQVKNYQKAAGLYRKAYQLKKDAMIMEKIRQCEQQPVAPPGPDPLAAVKENTNFKAFQKANDRKAFYTAYQHLKKVKQAFPNNRYINEELLLLENKLRNIAEGNNDERLINYYSYIDKGNLQQALSELKVQISNDPEYPVFLQLQKALVKRIKEQQEAKREEQQPLLYRLFGTFSTRWKVITVFIFVALTITFVVLYIRDGGKKSLSELRVMLRSNPDKAVRLLIKKANKEDDSARLVLGDYYRDKADYYRDPMDYWRASSWYADASLPAALSAVGKMFYHKQMRDYVDTAKARWFFEEALKLGTDTTANYYLGLIALEKDKSNYTTKYWEEAIKNLKEGYENGCMDCKKLLGDIYFKKGKDLGINNKYDDAYPYLIEAAYYENSNAMNGLGNMFVDTAWRKYNKDSALAWYRSAIQYNNPTSFNNYATFFMDRAYGSPNYDSAYYLLLRAKDLDPSLDFVYINLAIVFEHGGYYVSKNRDSAVYYYQIAANKGNQTAKDALIRLRAGSVTR